MVRKLILIMLFLAHVAKAYPQTKYIDLRNGSSSTGLNDITLSNASCSEFDGYGAVVPNSPSSNWYAAVLTIGNSERGVQLSHGYPNYNELYFRGGTDGWHSWRRILNDANFSSFALPLTGGAIQGDLFLNGVSYPKIQLADRLMLQVPMALENSYTRSFVGQNITWNGTTNKWSVSDQTYSDFSMMRFENGGTISFYNRVGGSSEMSNAELEAYRRMTIDYYGNVGIGTAAPQAKLAVNGDIFSKKVKVTQTGWADFVFEPTYKLPSLQEVELFIKRHKHLPEVPSAADVEKNGLDLGDNQATLLKKIEELTLYVIEQNKRIEEQSKRLEQLEKLRSND